METKGDFVQAAVDIGDADGGECGAKFADRDFHAAGVGERVELDRLALDDSVLATQGETGATRATQNEEARYQEGAIDQCFGGEHAVKLSGGMGVGKSQ